MAIPRRQITGAFAVIASTTAIPANSKMTVKLIPSRPFTVPDADVAIATRYKIPFRSESIVFALDTAGTIVGTYNAAGTLQLGVYSSIIPTDKGDPADVFYWAEHTDWLGKKWMELWRVASGSVTGTGAGTVMASVPIEQVIVADPSDLAIAETGADNFIRTTGGTMTGMLIANAGVRLGSGNRFYLGSGAQTYFEPGFDGQGQVVLKFYISGVFVGSISPS